MSAARAPRVTIGLPVYNGANYLAAAIESILNQTFTDLTLLISDNASTDETREICERYVAADPRVRYHRQERNLGVGPNHDWCARQATTQYFKWASHDDLLEPEYLKKCIAALDATPDAVLCHSRTKIIGRDQEMLAAHLDGLDSASPAERFAALVLKPHWGVQLFGVIRTSVLQETELQTGYFGRDKALLAELALGARLLEIPEPLFLNRDHPQRSMRAVPFHRRQSFHDSRSASQKVTHWALYTDYCRAVANAELDPREKAACYAVLARWWVANLHAVRLLLDVVYAKAPALAEPMYRLREAYHRRGIGAARKR